MTVGKFEVYTDKSGHWRFRLKAVNGQIVATGQGYSSRATCIKGIESVKANAPSAEIIDVEE